MLHAKNGTLQLKQGEMDYIRFGKGEKTLILLPGLGEALQTVKGTALPMSLLYREFTKDFCVYMFSRKTTLPKEYSTAQMARDMKEAMDVLGIRSAAVVGVSMGGMIAQHLAADYPEKVDKLVLVVTCAEPNPTLKESVGEWVFFAKEGDHRAFMDSNVKRIYSDDYYRRNKWLIPITGKLTKPKSYERFYTQAKACVTHDAVEKLGRIKAATLVVGGEMDKALGGEPSRQLAKAISNAKLKLYPQWGHGLYEEEKGFQRLVHHFLNT